MRKTRPFVRKTPIPIYGGMLHLVVGNTPDEMQRGVDRIGFTDDVADGSSCHLYLAHKPHHALVFRKERLTHADISHEVFHFAHRRLEFAGHDFSPRCHEPTAYLVSWATKWLYDQLKGHFRPTNRYA